MAMNGNRSEAYDLALFEPRQATIVELKPNKKQLKVEHRRARVQSVLNAIVTVAVAAVVIGVVSMMITTRVQLTELDNAMGTYQSRLAELKSEQTRLEAELAKTLSAQSVDDYAQSQGMTAIENNQIHYITRGDGDEVEVTEKAEAHWWDSVFDAITKFFS